MQSLVMKGSYLPMFMYSFPDTAATLFDAVDAATVPCCHTVMMGYRDRRHSQFNRALHFQEAASKKRRD